MKPVFRYRTAIVILAIAVALGGCETHEKTGALFGAAIGAVIGSKFGDGSGNAAATAVGGLIGALLGQTIGKQLDEAERLKAEKTTQLALDAPKGKTVTWQSDNRPEISGYSEPTSEPRNDTGKVCRQVRNVIIIGGEESVSSDRFCWTGSTWEPA